MESGCLQSELAGCSKAGCLAGGFAYMVEFPAHGHPASLLNCLAYAVHSSYVARDLLQEQLHKCCLPLAAPILHMSDTIHHNTQKGKRK